jgi:N-acetyl-alpha-D-glucosaminyl L-malate synthase BshA
LPFRLRPKPAEIQFHEIQVSSYPLFRYPPFILNAACRMSEVADAARLDILHVHYAVPWAVCAHLAQEVSAPADRFKIVTTLHGTDITLVGAEPGFYKMTKFGIEQSDAVTAVSEYLARETRRTFGITQHIEVIHNSVDSQRFRPRPGRPGREQFASHGERVMMHVSNFRPVKNIPMVIEVFARVRRKLPARLLMVGEGPEVPRARELARARGVEADVSFLGAYGAVEELLACADLFLLPSLYESFGLAALEAMSCGVPVLATQVGGLAEVISSGVDGWLCCVDDLDGMADRALELLTDETKRQAMGAAARRKAAEQFTPTKEVAKYEAVYRRALGIDG